MNQINKEFIILQPIEIENKNLSDIPIEEFIKQDFRLGYDVDGDNYLQTGLELWPKFQQKVFENSIRLCEELKSIATQFLPLKGYFIQQAKQKGQNMVKKNITIIKNLLNTVSFRWFIKYE